MTICVAAPFILTWFSARGARGASVPPFAPALDRGARDSRGIDRHPLVRDWFTPAESRRPTRPGSFRSCSGPACASACAARRRAIFSTAWRPALFTAQSLQGHSANEVLTIGYVLVMQFVLVLASLIGLVPAIVIKERDQTMDRLRTSDERFGSTFEHAAVGMACVGIDGRWLKVNPALCSLTGYTAAELEQKTFQDITHPDDYGIGESALRRMLANEISMGEVEKRYLHKDGHAIWGRGQLVAHPRWPGQSAPFHRAGARYHRAQAPRAGNPAAQPRPCRAQPDQRVHRARKGPADRARRRVPHRRRDGRFSHGVDRARPLCDAPRGCRRPFRCRSRWAGCPAPVDPVQPALRLLLHAGRPAIRAASGLQRHRP